MSEEVSLRQLPTYRFKLTSSTPVKFDCEGYLVYAYVHNQGKYDIYVSLAGEERGDIDRYILIERDSEIEIEIEAEETKIKYLWFKGSDYGNVDIEITRYVKDVF